MNEAEAIPLAPWEPDKGPFNEGTSDSVNNVQPITNGWCPVPDRSAISVSLGSLCYGATYYRTSSGAFGLIAGTATKFWKLNTGAVPYTWDDITGATVPNISIGQIWQFLRSGNQLYVTSLDTPLQSFDVDAGVTFVDVAGSPPKAKYIAQLGDFILLGYLKVGATEYPTKWMVSGINAPTIWTVGTQLSDEQVIPDGDEIMNVLGGPDGGRVIQRRAKRALLLTPDAAMAIKMKTIDADYGAVAPYAIVKIGGDDYAYLAEDGFKRGDQKVPIGSGRVDDYFFADVDASKLEQVQGTVDPVQHMVWWRYQDNNGDYKMIGWDWELDRWARSDIAATMIVPIVNPGVTLEALDAIFLALYGSSSIDTAAAESFDSPRWKGGRPLFAVFGTDFILYTLSGSPRAATMDTVARILSGNSGMVSKVTGVRGLIDSDSYTAQLAISATHGAVSTGSFGGAGAVSRIGVAPVRGSGRLARVRLNVPAGTDWSFCHGAIPLTSIGGRG
jgi:hypothetical protein